jgi:phi13 family phage major tail protein
MLVGFKRAWAIPHVNGKDLAPIAIEGKENKGATTEAEISGLSPDTVKVAGSDITYYISRKGVGDIKVALGLLDLPEMSADILLGYKGADKEDSITYIGNDSEAPYSSLLLESADNDGTALFAFYKGTFSREKVSLKSLDPNKTFEPEADDWTFSAMASDTEDETKGQYVGKYFGSNDEAITKIKTQVGITTTGTTAPK